MYRPRIIPVLLLNNDHLVKSIKFSNYNYIGDPINAVKIFNDLSADELVFLDITATKEKRLISLDFVKEVGEEANMPFSVGGGIKSLEDIQRIIAAGAEKVIISHAAINDENFIKSACENFGSSTIAVCIDVKKNFWGKEKLCSLNAKKTYEIDAVSFAKKMEHLGVGEIIIQSVDYDGTMKGYNESLIDEIIRNVSIPVVCLGGASSLQYLKNVYQKFHPNGLAAGSLFVYQGDKNGVLINYPNKQEKQRIYEK
jgi:imidazole glycerol-phosphate synthase subunit HisF